jgi:hypothetical protein
MKSKRDVFGSIFPLFLILLLKNFPSFFPYICFPRSKFSKTAKSVYEKAMDQIIWDRKIRWDRKRASSLFQQEKKRNEKNKLSRSYFFIITYLRAFPNVWSSPSNWNEAAVSNAPGNYRSSAEGRQRHSIKNKIRPT